MAKKNNQPPIVKMPGLGSQFEDFFNDDSIVVESGEKVADTATLDTKKNEPSQKNRPVDSATPSSAQNSIKKKEKVPGKKKTATRPARTESVPEPTQSTPPLATNFAREDLNWFFSHSAVINQPKQLYVDESTKETLHHVAKAAGLPVGHLTDNVVRWFLLANKAEIVKIIARNRDPYQRLDS